MDIPHNSDNKNILNTLLPTLAYANSRTKPFEDNSDYLATMGAMRNLSNITLEVSLDQSALFHREDEIIRMMNGEELGKRIKLTHAYICSSLLQYQESCSRQLIIKSQYLIKAYFFKIAEYL